ncbi:AraC family transcriptional regulator [Streptomyces pseudovenezuelae]|uniref:AraC-like DNA-binding protein n=1 Tax=Streptomyces pseudovenezuelae TaxID=67350 RepID=A0ABT6M305_9ACTN|nr:AraC family transcriptional regulator [Streptomyces pseudovenezuelae]MDH6222029.1 AraC-like DNA-binding protein [Streptomyces pseudovenezuelae]
MTEPLADVIGLLHPRVVLWKKIEGTGRWALRFEANPDINFGVVTTGHCWLQCEGGPVGLTKGDFLLLSGPPAFTFSSDIDEDTRGDVVDGERTLAGTQDNHLRLGSEGGPAVQLLAGHFAIEPENADLLLDLLPTVVHLRAGTDGAGRIASLLELIGDEAGADRPGASLVLTRLVEVMLVEALRSAPATLEQPPAGLLAGLSDPPVAAALHAIHANVARPWTVAGLAAEARISRSVLAERFVRRVGLTPIEYLLSWRMAMAKRALRQGNQPIAEIARMVGYGSTSAFSTAFSRVTGSAPGRYAHQRAV